MDKETNEIIKEIFKMYESMALDSNVLALIKVLKKWYFEKEDYKSRIDKAIEYIERYLRLNLEAFDTKDLLEKILEILNKDGEE